ncbi:GGDEF domain-containing protein [Salinivibrio sp. IB643]|jgi:FOG: GGDEF domain|uniref:GGDEF domain-containing protein n=1 Tax=Salinivibrio TaxID=51366 RepID=UPI000988DD62|nr:GGDEF domain-containing protein [Salinivibrio sp. IB643]
MLQDQAITDSLTLLRNRRYFYQHLYDLDKTRGDIALMVFDIDDFKAFNDGFGHAHGDEVLCFVAKTATILLPKDAIIARIGGEEFAILQYFSSAKGALAQARLLCRGCATEFSAI